MDLSKVLLPRAQVSQRVSSLGRVSSLKARCRHRHNGIERLLGPRVPCCHVRLLWSGAAVLRARSGLLAVSSVGSGISVFRWGMEARAPGCALVLASQILSEQQQLLFRSS